MIVLTVYVVKMLRICVLRQPPAAWPSVLGHAHDEKEDRVAGEHLDELQTAAQLHVPVAAERLPAAVQREDQVHALGDEHRYPEGEKEAGDVCGHADGSAVSDGHVEGDR